MVVPAPAKVDSASSSSESDEEVTFCVNSCSGLCFPGLFWNDDWNCFNREFCS